jgi:hypothetical protein
MNARKCLYPTISATQDELCDTTARDMTVLAH